MLQQRRRVPIPLQGTRVQSSHAAVRVAEIAMKHHQRVDERDVRTARCIQRTAITSQRAGHEEIGAWVGPGTCDAVGVGVGESIRVIVVAAAREEEEVGSAVTTEDEGWGFDVVVVGGAVVVDQRHGPGVVVLVERVAVHLAGRVGAELVQHDLRARAVGRDEVRRLATADAGAGGVVARTGGGPVDLIGDVPAPVAIDEERRVDLAALVDLACEPLRVHPWLRGAVAEGTLRLVQVPGETKAVDTAVRTHGRLGSVVQPKAVIEIRELSNVGCPSCAGSSPRGNVGECIRIARRPGLTRLIELRSRHRSHLDILTTCGGGIAVNGVSYLEQGWVGKVLAIEQSPRLPSSDIARIAGRKSSGRPGKQRSERRNRLFVECHIRRSMAIHSEGLGTI
nr:hypothetical protein CFP56_56963 [Quercus suber]